MSVNQRLALQGDKKAKHGILIYIHGPNSKFWMYHIREG